MADDDLPQQFPNSTPIVREIEHKKSCTIIRPTMSSSPKNPKQERTDYHQLQETGSSLPDAPSIDHIDSVEGAVPDYCNPEIIRFFGVNLMVMNCDSTTSGIHDHVQATSPSFSHSLTDHHPHQKREETSNEEFRVNNHPRKIMLFGVNLLGSSDSTGTRVDDDDDREKREKTKGKQKIVINEKKKNNNNNAGNPTYKRTSKNLNIGQEQQPNAPVNPPRITQEIEHHQPLVFVFEKKLEYSDIANSQNRLYITKSDTLMEALTDEERRKVERKDDYLRIITRDPQGKEYILHLTKWHTVDMVVLKHDWCKLVATNRLQKGDSVRGWGYRRDDEFRLALNFVTKEQ